MEFLGYKQGDFPVTEKVTSEILSLPKYPKLTDQQIETVVSEIKAILVTAD
jgi:UDP-2-acetamido-2-deoxy-ribo-hexuluronate aminotransferase